MSKEKRVSRSDLVEMFLVKPGSKARLDKIDPDFTGGWTKEEAKERTAKNHERMAELEGLAYASKKLAFLFTFNGRDGGGKGGATKAFARAMNPYARTVAWKKPTEIELAHDSGWRIHKEFPAKGEVALFDRSHLEDVIIVPVRKLKPKEVWKADYDNINNLFKMAADHGTVSTQFYLYISEEERYERFRDRRDDPKKRWKRGNPDFTENTGPIVGRYNRYTEIALTKCSTKQAPVYIVPANRNWFRDFVLSEIAVARMEEALKKASAKYPDPEIDPELEAAYFARFEKQEKKAAKAEAAAAKP